jgi:hypothetical protein
VLAAETAISPPNHLNGPGEEGRWLSFFQSRLHRTRLPDRSLDRPGESKIVHDHSVRPDRHFARIRQIELTKHDLVAPDLSTLAFAIRQFS